MLASIGNAKTIAKRLWGAEESFGGDASEGGVHLGTFTRACHGTSQKCALCVRDGLVLDTKSDEALQGIGNYDWSWLDDDFVQVDAIVKIAAASCERFSEKILLAVVVDADLLTEAYWIAGVDGGCDRCV